MEISVQWQLCCITAAMAQIMFVLHLLQNDGHSWELHSICRICHKPMQRNKVDLQPNSQQKKKLQEKFGFLDSLAH